MTRPAEDAVGVAAALAARGWEVQIEPLLTIVFHPDIDLPLHGVQGFLATSANGVRALARHPATRALPVWAVGAATARCAEEHGFRLAGCADGDVDALVALVARQADRTAGTLLHAAGAERAGQLTEILAARGFATRRLTVYTAETARALTPSVHRALREETLTAALFFSPRTAATFVSLVAQAGLVEHCRRLVACCLSPAVADRLATLAWRAIGIAAEPQQDSLLAVLDGLAMS